MWNLAIRRWRWRWPRRVIAFAVIACAVSCSEPEPVGYRMGSGMNLGRVTMTVQRTEADVDRSARALIVHVGFTGINSNEQAVRIGLLNWKGRIKLVDKDNKRYKCLGLMPADTYYKFKAEASGDVRAAWAWGDTWLENTSAPIPHEWVLLFEVPADSSGYMLLIDNVDATRDQPRLISVVLDR